MAGAAIKSHLARLSPNRYGGDVKQVLRDTWRLCAVTAQDAGMDILMGQAFSPGDITDLAVNSAFLTVDIGMAIYRSASMRKQLALCLAEYTLAGLLQLKQLDGVPRWTTTRFFRPVEVLTEIYDDVAEYSRQQGISFEEIKQAVGWQDDVDKVVIYAHHQSNVSDASSQLAALCSASGGALSDFSKTDLNRRLNNVQFPKVAGAALANACAVEADRRAQRRRDGLEPDDRIVMVLGRVIALAAICEIRELNLGDITTILGKLPLFETATRQRIANIRRHHASQIINTLLFQGRTDFLAEFTDDSPLVQVGLIKEHGQPKFFDQWVRFRCGFTNDKVDLQTVPIDTPIYMQAGWSKLLQQRESFARAQVIANRFTRTHFSDIHGNVYIRNVDILPWIMFKAESMSTGDGRLLIIAQPKKFGNIEYAGSSDFRRGSDKTYSSGKEKHYGGLVGPLTCDCTDSDVSKTRVTRRQRFGSEDEYALRVANYDCSDNSIEHNNSRSSHTVGLLWQAGDWAMGVFLMQMMPQSSYLQGRGQCIHCAVESAARAGCADVIVCGGGRVSKEAAMMRDNPVQQDVQEKDANRPKLQLPSRKPIAQPSPSMQTSQPSVKRRPIAPRAASAPQVPQPSVKRRPVAARSPFSNPETNTLETYQREGMSTAEAIEDGIDPRESSTASLHSAADENTYMNDESHSIPQLIDLERKAWQNIDSVMTVRTSETASCVVSKHLERDNVW